MVTEPDENEIEPVDWAGQAKKMKNNAEDLERRRAEKRKPLTEEQIRQVRIRRLEDAGFAPRYAQDAVWDRIPDTIAGAVREWLDDIEQNMAKGHGFWMGGGVGTGKTMAAAMMADEILRYGHTVRFAHAAFLFDRLVAIGNASELWASWVDPDVLIIDDLGREYDSDWPMTRFSWIVEERYGHHSPIIVTSNREPKDFREDDASWEAIISRIGHGASSVWYDGPDQRKE